jgi:hypothetical protein
VFEQGGPSRNIPVIELYWSSNKEAFFADTAWDVEFARWLLGDLNRDLLRPSSDSKLVVLIDSDEEEEEREVTAVNTDGTSSATVKSSTPAPSTVDAD